MSTIDGHPAVVGNGDLPGREILTTVRQQSETRRMHRNNLSAWTHDHVFDQGSLAAERGTRVVMWITAAMMVVEIAAGWWFNSTIGRRCLSPPSAWWSISSAP